MLIGCSGFVMPEGYELLTILGKIRDVCLFVSQVISQSQPLSAVIKLIGCAVQMSAGYESLTTSDKIELFQI